MISDRTTAREVWPHLWFSSASTFFGPGRGQGRSWLRRGSCFQRIEMKELLESNSLVQWLIFFCTFLRTDLSLAFQFVASRISNCQGTEEKPLQTVRPLGVVSESWQKQIHSASLPTPDSRCSRALSRLHLCPERTWVADSQATELKKLKVALAGAIYAGVANF